MNLQQTLASYIQKTLLELYDYEADIDFNTIPKTKKEFEGDFTFVVFPYVKALRKSPDQLAIEIGEKLAAEYAELVKDFNVIKGFLNVSLQDAVWMA
jgi:arginyl-tRNA synthetase